VVGVPRRRGNRNSVRKAVADGVIAEGRQEEALALINQYEIEDASTVRAVPGAERLLRSLPSDSWAVVTSALSGLARKDRRIRTVLSLDPGHSRLRQPR